MSVPKAKANKRRPRPSAAPAPRALLYKVVELSTVDERSLEDAVNGWSRQGWRLDGVQFAMRESSKRPAMAFVFFTKDGGPLSLRDEVGGFRDSDAAAQRLHALAEAAPDGEPVAQRRLVSAHERLRQLAGDDA